MLENNKGKKSNANRTRRKPIGTQIREQKFVDAIREGKKQGDAVIEAGYKVKNRVVASQIGTELLKRPSVLALLNSHELEAEETVIEIMKNRSELSQNRLNAAKLLLAYTRGNPVSRNENLNVSVSLEDILSS